MLVLYTFIASAIVDVENMIGPVRLPLHLITDIHNDEYIDYTEQFRPSCTPTFVNELKPINVQFVTVGHEIKLLIVMVTKHE